MNATNKQIGVGALRAGLAALLLCLFVSPARAQDSGDPWALAQLATDAMELWDYDTAESTVAMIEAGWPGSVAAHFMRGRMHFHAGDYDAAAVSLRAAADLAPGAEAIDTLRARVEDTIEVVRTFETYTTRDGLFEIRYDARDAVLIPWAEETLESAYYEIGYDVGYWPEPPIRVEIYPRARTLAAVSSLTEEAIEASGTIALCKYNKLMFTSPRAALRGYDWRTTLAHEYVHYVVGHLTHAEIPIWLHEALAKYLEARWTGTRDIQMGAYRASLLSRRVADDDLITFDEMHPSMAYLPTQEDASTAYAEVFTVMAYLVSRRGTGVIRQLLDRLREGDEVIEAFENTVGEPFDVFEDNWMAYLRALPPVEIPGTFDDEIQLMPESGADPTVDRWAGVPNLEARDRLQLGELLRARDLVAAAIVEYERAELLLGSANPMLQNALARAYLDVGRAEDALAAVAEVTEWHPGFYRSHLHRGEALNRLERFDEAVPALLRAGGINPFDPAVHTELATAYAALGEDALAERHRAFSREVAR